MASQILKFRFLTAKQLMRLHQLHVVPKQQPTQLAMLESAVQSPMNIKHYTNEQNIFLLAATLTEKVIKNHAYQDGNKRTALIAADMFLKINGYQLQAFPMKPDEVNQKLEDAHVAVCTNQWTVEQLGQFYKDIATALDEETSEITTYKEEAVEC